MIVARSVTIPCVPLVAQYPFASRPSAATTVGIAPSYAGDVSRVLLIMYSALLPRWGLSSQKIDSLSALIYSTVLSDGWVTRKQTMLMSGAGSRTTSNGANSEAASLS